MKFKYVLSCGVLYTTKQSPITIQSAALFSVKITYLVCDELKVNSAEDYNLLF